MFRRRIVSVIAALATVVVAAACSENPTETNVGQASETGAATSSTTSSTAGSTASPTETASPTVVSSGGRTIDIGGGTLPEGFPESVPIPDDAGPVYSFSRSDKYSVFFSCDKSLQELRSFFDENLPKNGWTIEDRIDGRSASAKYTVYLIRGNGFSGGVYLGEGVEGSSTFSGEYAFYVLLSRE
ncbi:MAG: hypothetical protein AB1551_09015 [Actinomycetota bacterium]